MRPHVVDPALGIELKNEILLVMRDSRAVVSMRTVRLAGNHLLCEAETESESNTDSDSDTKRNTITDADAVTNSHTYANTEG